MNRYHYPQYVPLKKTIGRLIHENAAPRTDQEQSPKSQSGVPDLLRHLQDIDDTAVDNKIIIRSEEDRLMTLIGRLRHESDRPTVD